MQQEQAPSTEDIAKAWANIKDAHVEPQVQCGEPSLLWTQARTQMLAVKERAAKRAQAEEARLREREASLMALRREAEDASRRSEAEQRLRREEEQRLEEEQRAEARRREREQREKMAQTVQFEEVWEVFS